MGTADVVRQEHAVWCWAAVVQMLRKHFGMAERRQCDIVGSRLRLDCCGVPVPDRCGVPHRMDSFQELLQREGIACRIGVPQGPLDERTLANELHSDRPVVIGWMWDQGGGHFVLAFLRPKVGSRKPNKIYYWVADPLEGVRRLTYEDLRSAVGNGAWSSSWYNLRES